LGGDVFFIYGLNIYTAVRPFLLLASTVWNSLSRGFHTRRSVQTVSDVHLRPICSQTYLFRRSFPRLFCCAREVTLVIMDTLIVLTYLHTHTHTHQTVSVRARMRNSQAASVHPNVGRTDGRQVDVGVHPIYISAIVYNTVHLRPTD